MSKQPKKYYVKLNREEAIEMTSYALVDELEHENCEPTDRLTEDETTEWKASINIPGSTDRLEAYYFTTPEEDEEMEEHDGDGSYIDWEIAYYVIVD